MRKSKRGWLEICMGLLLLAVACSFWQENVHNNNQAAIASEFLIADLQMQLAMQDHSQSAISEKCSTFVASENNLSENNLSENNLGILEIPILSLMLPIQADYGEKLLKNAPCRYTVSGVEATRLIICGHNYRSQFGTLRQLVLGDKIYFTDMNGNVFLYTVSEVTTIAQDDFASLTMGDWDLLLLTCTTNRLRRVLIHCQLG